MTRLGGSGSSGVSEVAIKCQPGLPFLMAGLGLEDPLKNGLHPLCWQQALVSYHVGLSTGNMAAVFPKSK